MQLFETLLILLVFVQIFSLFIKSNHRPKLAYVGLGLMALHIILGEARWQMFFTYGVEAVIILVLLRGSQTKSWIRLVSCLFAVILNLVSAALAYALPIFSLPEPEGSYQVGLIEHHLPINSRKELTTENPDDVRELMINVWYPSTNTVTNPEIYLPKVEREGFAIKYGLPLGTFSYLNKIKTNHQNGLTPAQGKFPILIFSPGYYTPASGYVGLIEEIVSQGYVVLNVIHPHETMGIEYPDGRKVYFNQEFSNNNSWNWNDDVAKAIETFNGSENQAIKREAVKTMLASYGKDMVERWALDIQNVIDALPRLNDQSDFLLNEHLDLSKLGSFGHSLGGAAAIENSIYNERVKATANLDGAQWGNLMLSDTNTPMLLLSSSKTNAVPDVNRFIFEKFKDQEFYNLVLENSGHSNFSDIPFMINIPQLNEAGSIPPKSAIQSTNEFLVSFFDKYLKNRSIDIKAHIEKDKHLQQR